MSSQRISNGTTSLVHSGIPICMCMQNWTRFSSKAIRVKSRRTCLGMLKGEPSFPFQRAPLLRHLGVYCRRLVRIRAERRRHVLAAVVQAWMSDNSMHIEFRGRCWRHAPGPSCRSRGKISVAIGTSFAQQASGRTDSMAWPMYQPRWNTHRVHGAGGVFEIEMPLSG